MKKDKVKLSILGITFSEVKSGVYAIILGQEDGPFHLPIIIGAPEAQAIALEIEGVKPPRPLTHDLFVSFSNAFGVALKSVYIYKFENGIFYSDLTFSDGEREVTIDSRTSDAIAIAIRTKSPIYTTSKILVETGFINEDTESAHKKINDSEQIIKKPKIENYTIEELERTLHQLVNNEEYEKAAIVSKILNEKKVNNK
ncbi:MAG: bifunctional nuclease family protein [Muribaculaceae bacterium]|nr:bifunctional nuclease family protein [Muribaculaceae bacterium]